ncbi:TPA: recombination-associated protein RdgC [Escherichia coli]|nr:recombination-associated protein RdgC [Escherichia coli]
MNNPFFKNMLVYRISRDFTINQEELEQQLELFRFTPCGSQDMAKTGWVSPLGQLSDRLHHTVNNQVLLVIRREEKILPSPVIAEELRKRVSRLESDQGRRLKKTEKDSLRDEVLHSLLPRAFSKNSTVSLWINVTLPPPVKTSGSRDALLEQLAIINPDLVAQEAQKPAPLKVSGTKADMIQAVKAVKPDAVFADELLDAWRDNPEGKVLVTRQQLSTALNIQKALLAHPTAGMLLTHPSRAVEVSYFGFDEETGLEVRVRPDLEIDLDGVRIGADLKTISMWNVKQESLRARLHREIIERDYHLSAAMYCETAALDQFFWIFVNKDENYHWIAIIEASAELLELGMLEYRKAMRNIATGFDTGEWPAPITADYTDELNDFDLRRLEALRTQA